MRKCLFLFLFLSSLHLTLTAQYWQQTVNYTIDVTLDDRSNSLDGFEKMEYVNHSPDTLHFIWIHLWPNAYKNDQTAFSDQLLGNGNTSFYFSDKSQKGFINRLDFKVNNITARTEDHPQHIDIIKLVLPEALAPGQAAIITTPFHVQLSYNFSRGGHDGESYQATQWFPKPAVYDAHGWHPMPYLDQGEFYSEFGRFDVKITLPQNYVVAATGNLQNADEKEWMNTRSGFSWTPVRIKTRSKGTTTTTTQLFPKSSSTIKTLHYVQDSIHDFAWFADKRFIVDHDTCRLSTGKIIDVYTFYTNEFSSQWKHSLQFAKDGTRHYSSLVGEYPYSAVSVVQGPNSFGGGMEYPMITVISPDADLHDLDNTIAHEIGHNWFYGILATNERQYPWMDEGMNTYYDNYYSFKKYQWTPIADRNRFERSALNKTDQPINTPSEKFNVTNYDLESYYKMGEWMRYLESRLGQDRFNMAMQDYFREWRFRHPQPDDFKRSIEHSTGQSLDSVFGLLDRTGFLPGLQPKGTGFMIPTMKNLNSTGKSNYRSLISLGPIAGFNSYDKLLIGGFLTNMKLSPAPFQFFVAPMYGTGSKRFAGMGLAFQTFYPSGIFRKIELGVAASQFDSDLYTDDSGKKNFLHFSKLVPGIKLTWKEKDPRSTFNRYAEFKTYFIKEEGLHFFRDTIITGIDTTIVNNYRLTHDSRSLLQLNLVIENTRELYPYRAELRFEKGESFYRASFTGNYFFNYPKNGGLQVRLFAGKFFFDGPRTISKSFATERYHLNMTGPNGYEDYTYSDYFVGRNKFEGLGSQQVMQRDGFFKVRTDLLANKVGQTDDWLVAANFSTTIPRSINPLSILPVKIPLKVFVDIGTYADAWKPNASANRFLYDAGLEIPLFLDLLHIYVPLIYSQEYSDYIKSTLEKKNRFWKKISFSIDLSSPRVKKLLRDL